MKMEWEVLSETMTTLTVRMQVPGGWIFRTSRYSDNAIADAMVFVPDPKHAWKPTP